MAENNLQERVLQHIDEKLRVARNTACNKESDIGNKLSVTWAGQKKEKIETLATCKKRRIRGEFGKFRWMSTTRPSTLRTLLRKKFQHQSRKPLTFECFLASKWVITREDAKTREAAKAKEEAAKKAAKAAERAAKAEAEAKAREAAREAEAKEVEALKLLKPRALELIETKLRNFRCSDESDLGRELQVSWMRAKDNKEARFIAKCVRTTSKIPGLGFRWAHTKTKDPLRTALRRMVKGIKVKPGMKRYGIRAATLENFIRSSRWTITNDSDNSETEPEHHDELDDSESETEPEPRHDSDL